MTTTRLLEGKLSDLSAPNLLEAMEENFTEYRACYGSAGGAELHDRADCLLIATGIRAPALNAVLRSRFEGQDLNQKIGEVVSFFKARSLPFHWAVGHGTRPVDLGERLVTLGLNHPFDIPAMAIDLGNPNLEHSPSSSLKIEPVRDRARLKEWIRIAWEGREPLHEELLEMEESLGLAEGLARQRYLGVVDGRPIASSILFLAGGVAGIYSVATAPSERGKGIGGAMTIEPLRQAQAQGYRVGVLQSSEMAFNLYRKLGFDEYYKTGLFNWRPG